MAALRRKPWLKNLSKFVKPGKTRTTKSWNKIRQALRKKVTGKSSFWKRMKSKFLGGATVKALLKGLTHCCKKKRKRTA